MIAALALVAAFAPGAELPSPPAGECAVVGHDNVTAEPTYMAPTPETESLTLIIVCGIKVAAPTENSPTATRLEHELMVIQVDADMAKIIVSASNDLAEVGR